MKLRYRLLTFALVLGFIGMGTSSSFAQVGDVGRILQASADDANLLVKEYLKPFGTGFGASLNSGWTNTAKTHKKLGFDITVSAGLASVPMADQTFDVTNIGLQELQLAKVNQQGNVVPANSSDNINPISQTINGSQEVGPLLGAFEDIDGDGDQENLFNFNMPQGSGFAYVPAPEIKGAIGLIKDTELMLRYVPQVNIQDYGTFKQIGVGAKHGINQWLPGGKLLPVDLSVMVGYTKQTLSADFRLTGEDVIVDQQNTENPYENQPETWDGQKMKIETSAYTINALVGKTLPIISVYGGVGYEASTMSLGTPGTYPTIENNPDYSGPSSGEKPLIVDTFDSPVNVDIEGENGFHALAGFRLRFTVLHISASYKLANYSTFNAGFGISFR